jgi:hypothetical protein
VNFGKFFEFSLALSSIERAFFDHHFGKAGLKNLSQKLSGITETEESNRNLDGSQTMGIKNSNINNASSSSRNPEKGTEGKSHDQSCDSLYHYEHF